MYIRAMADDDDDPQEEEAKSAFDTLPEWFRDHVPLDVATSSLFRFNIRLNGSIIPVDLTQDIGIDFEILEQQHEQIPAQYIYWASVYSELRSNVATIEVRIKGKRKVITNTALEHFRQKGVKLTDKQLDKIIDGDEDLRRLEAELIIGQKQCGKVYHMVKAIELRSEHTRSLAGFKRQEKTQSSRLV